MPKQLQLTVSSACHENWETMSASEQGRFCAQCQKQVIDFSAMNDRQLAEFFKKPAAGSVCGRFYTAQLERPIDIPRKRISWVRYFFQFTLPAFLLSLKTIPVKAQAPVKLERNAVKKAISKPQQDTLMLPEVVITSQTVYVPQNTSNQSGGCYQQSDLSKALTGKIGCLVSVYEPPPSIDKIRDLRVTGMGLWIAPKTDTSHRLIRGITQDENGNPLYGIIVRIKGTMTRTVSDGTGAFSIQAKPGDVLIASGVGCEFSEMKISGDNNRVLITMQRVMMGTVSYKKVKRRKKEIKPIQATASIKNQITAFQVYPNPAVSGQRLLFECDSCETGKYLLQFTNMSGQTVHHEMIEISSRRSKIELILPTMPPGYYVVNLTKEITQQKYFANLVIQ